LAVKPGMTGPMQVLGRGRLSLEERVALERDYVETISLTGDVRILLRTIGSVLGGRGAT
jgi:lipopolysaccharide/colanic/teichoic acid biosynthesis glycosyltransferase